MASNEKVVLCGITFDKDTDIYLGALQRKQNGDFYGITFQKDKEYLNKLNEYLNGGERYIDIATNQIYTYNKKVNMWIGEGEQLQFHTITVQRVGNKFDINIECVVKEYDAGDYELYIIEGTLAYCEFSNASILTDDIGRRYIVIGSINTSTDITYGGEVSCKYSFGSNGKWNNKLYNGTILFDELDIKLYFDSDFSEDIIDGYLNVYEINGEIYGEE